MPSLNDSEWINIITPTSVCTTWPLTYTASLTLWLQCTFMSSVFSGWEEHSCMCSTYPLMCKPVFHTSEILTVTSHRVYTLSLTVELPIVAAAADAGSGAGSGATAATLGHNQLPFFKIKAPSPQKTGFEHWVVSNLLWLWYLHIWNAKQMHFYRRCVTDTVVNCVKTYLLSCTVGNILVTERLRNCIWKSTWRRASKIAVC